jgi:hypothetical protein
MGWAGLMLRLFLGGPLSAFWIRVGDPIFQQLNLSTSLLKKKKSEIDSDGTSIGHMPPPESIRVQTDVMR